ncbi:hypothetical protein TrRE_jg9894 [Triparma retinervis]|uniref:Uncharacterized protein n=1 Tax=Triparma retinervis TaxID=2557542 RepID=A0A9W6ZNJ7_9STRA|nr:hypothetical protein TrRE_jg9894 [Triparma retinervis]
MKTKRLWREGNEGENPYLDPELKRRKWKSCEKPLNMSLSSKLNAGGSVASNAIISTLSTNPTFLSFASSEGSSIQARDAEDGLMLESGINLSMSTGVLSESDRSTAPTTTITVDGKTPDEVANIIMSSLPKEPSAKGRVVTIVGLSGVVMAWSNGNVFRSLTLLTSLHMSSTGSTDLQDTISGPSSAALKASMMSMLSFEKDPKTGDLDTHIVGYGVDYWVADVQTTELKGPLVSGRIPTVAKATQGEVVKFVRSAVRLLTEDGFDVVVEGREETVSFIGSGNRFELRMEDDTVIGKRRAAQRIAGAYEKRGGGERGDEEVVKVLGEIMEEIM